MLQPAKVVLRVSVKQRTKSMPKIWEWQVSVFNVFKIETMFYELWSVIEMHGMPLLVVLWSRHCQKWVKVERLICIKSHVINRQKN